MEAIPEENPLTEHFSFAEVTWEIKNMSIALCPLTQKVYSEEFQITGRDDTLWRMNLSISREHNTVGLFLKMMGPDRQFYCYKFKKPIKGLLVNCYANILDSTGEQSLKSEKSNFFNFRDSIEIETFDLSDILRNLPHMGPDYLTIRCYILVDHGERVDVPADVPNGLIQLSSTMEKLVNDPLLPDIKVFVNNKIFYLHKEMFSHIDGMARFMWEKFKHVRLFNHCEYSLTSIFSYAYSGNINHIIGSPRIRVADDIERLIIPELSGAYPKERIPLQTTIGVKEFTYDWEIYDLEHKETSLTGPAFNVDGTNWKICMHPKGTVIGVQGKKYVFLEATLLESTRTSIDVNIEFCSLNERDIIHSLRDHKRMKVGDKLDVPIFLRGGMLMKKCLINKNLSLRLTLWISTGQITTNLGDVIRPLPFTWANTRTLNYFSRKMRNILAYHRNWDLGLVCDNVLFKVHKFVLASRSSFFKNRMSNIPHQVIPLPEFKKHFMRVFLEYVYTGLYCDMGFDATCHLYEFGFLFEIRLLKDRCRQDVGFYNLLKVFEYATDNNLRSLRNETFQHIVNIGDGITEHPDWSDFFTTRTDLSHAIISYWK